MQKSQFFIIVAIITVLVGLASLFIPDQFDGWCGLTLDASGRLMSRFFGSSLIALAILVFMARDLGASNALTGILWAGLITNVIDVVVNVWAVFAGTVNGRAWVTVIINLLFAIGFAYFLFGRPPQKT